MERKRRLKTTDDLIRLCDELEAWKKRGLCNIDEISYTRSKLKQYINGDRNKALELKVQIEIKKNKSSLYNDYYTLQFDDFNAIHVF